MTVLHLLEYIRRLIMQSRSGIGVDHGIEADLHIASSVHISHVCFDDHRRI